MGEWVQAKAESWQAEEGQRHDLAELRRVVDRGHQLNGFAGDALPMACLAWMHDLGASARMAEVQGATRSEIQRVMHPARLIHAESPFVARLQSWPRGYAGIGRPLPTCWRHAHADNPERAPSELNGRR